MKKSIYVICGAVFLAVVIFRIFTIASESSRAVYNPHRDIANRGAPVEMVDVVQKTDVLKEPLTIKNNRAYVSSGRVKKLHIGQKVENGTIVSVSKNLDIDSGMHIVRTSGVSNGMHMVEVKYNGVFVPIHAVFGDTVMVNENGYAVRRQIKIIAIDSEQAVIASGLKQGEKVIVSTVEEGDFVR